MKTLILASTVGDSTAVRRRQKMISLNSRGTLSIEQLVMIVPLQCAHGFDYEEDSDSWALTVADHYLNQINKRLPEFATATALTLESKHSAQTFIERSQAGGRVSQPNRGKLPTRLESRGLLKTSGVSVSRLRSACEAVCGETPIEMIHHRRLTEAKRHLLFTDMTLEQIAYWLGFSSPCYFAKFFKKETREPPAYFRRTRRGSKPA